MNSETIIVAIIATALGFFIGRIKAAKAESELALSQQQSNTYEVQSVELKNKLNESKGQLITVQENLSEKEQANAALDANLKAEQKQHADKNQQFETVQAEVKQERLKTTSVEEERNTANQELAELRTANEKQEQHHKEQLALFEEQKAVLKTEFENLANDIFKKKGEEFTVSNKSSIDELLKPFKTQMTEFKTKVEDIHSKDIEQRTELKTELKNLQVLNQQITEEAHNLATALKGQKKMQGNWGEMILENVLDRSGLVKGKDYKREVSINTDEGRSRPDAIVYLPDNKHLIIDAKVSLNAYTRYVNAEDDLERDQALAEHVSAVSDRIKELSDRNYFDLPGINSPEMVFMFIPIESAFVEAMKADESIFQKALELNVLVATPTTLLTSLNIVRQLWRFEDQNKHTAELADKASKVYDKLRLFVGSMESVGKSLDKAKTSYDTAYGQLTNGRANLIKQASEFKQLGVSVKTELPEHIVDKAALELNYQPATEEVAIINNESSTETTQQLAEAES